MNAWAQTNLSEIQTPEHNLLQLGERINHAAFDPHSGDYRVCHFSLAEDVAHKAPRLRLELHRQGPGFPRRIFVLFDTVLDAAEQKHLQPIMPALQRVAMLLRARQLPPADLLAPFMNRSAMHLWTKPLLLQHGGSHE